MPVVQTLRYYLSDLLLACLLASAIIHRVSCNNHNKQCATVIGHNTTFQPAFWVRPCSHAFECSVSRPACSHVMGHNTTFQLAICNGACTKHFYRCDAATNDADINDAFGKGSSQGASADHKAPSGALSSGSEERDTGRATNARSAGINGRHVHFCVAGEPHCGSALQCLCLLGPQPARVDVPSYPSLFIFCPSCTIWALKQRQIHLGVVPDVTLAGHM